MPCIYIYIITNNNNNSFHIVFGTSLLCLLTLPTLLYLSSYEISISNIIGTISIFSSSKVDEEERATKQKSNLCSSRYIYIHDLPPMQGLTQTF